MSILTYFFGNTRTNKPNTKKAAKNRANLIRKLSAAQNNALRLQSKKNKKAQNLGTTIVNETKSALHAVNFGGTRRVKRGRKGTRRQRGGNPEALKKVCENLRLCLLKKYRTDANGNNNSEENVASYAEAAVNQHCLTKTIKEAKDLLSKCNNPLSEVNKYLRKRA